MLRILVLCTLSLAAGAETPDGFWSAEEAQSILDATLSITLQPRLESLSEAERAALDHLLDAGTIMQQLYLRQRHAEAAAARDLLDDVAHAAVLAELYYLFQGPIATTLDNQREAFLPVSAEQPGKAMYPAEADRAAIAAASERDDWIVAERSLVRAADPESLAADIEALDRHPAVESSIPGLRDYLESRGDADYYAVPYALAFADELSAVRQSLFMAASLLRDSSPDFADYLELRARDFLSGDYEAGDAAWVSGDFDGLNLQIGSYETYDDALFGVKAFFGASVLARDEEKSAALAGVVANLQALEDALPYEHQRAVRSSIPVGVYNVIADFGQARGGNSATILPNDADHTRKYGRTILIRNNILTAPALFERKQHRFDTVVSPEFRGHLTMAGTVDFTLWHEIGHYIGVSEAADGRSLDEALGDLSDLFEELKSDLASLNAAKTLQAQAYYDENGKRAHYAAGILRTLAPARPRPAQPYQNMQLMQFNFFMEFGLLEPDLETGLMRVNYDAFEETVERMLNEVLHIQYAGDYEAARAYVARWNYWEELLHGRLAERMRAGDQPRYLRVRYGILDD